MVTLLNLLGGCFGAFGCLLWLGARLDSGLMAWIVAAVFFVGAGIIDELQKRIARLPRPAHAMGPGDKVRPPPR
jgi:hypothetical protein